MRKPLPNQDELLLAFSYDVELGILRWRVREDMRSQWNAKYAGKEAGNETKGKINVHFGKYGLLRAHKIIWKIVYGSEPYEIDHIDGNPYNNRLKNLRAVSHQQNAMNMRGHSICGIKGVSRHKSGLWRARLKAGDAEFCSYHKSKELAGKAYLELAKLHFGSFARIT